MKKHQKILVGLLFVALLGSALPFFMFPDLNKADLGRTPLSAVDDITSDHVTIDKSLLKRAINTVNITFNNSVPLNSESFEANLTFSDDSSLILPLANSSSFPLVWSALYTPSVTNITGVVNISIIPTTGGYENNVIDGTFTIQNNLPTVSVQFDKSAYLRGDTISMDFYPSDVEQSVADLKWVISLYRSGSDIPVETFVTNESIFEYEYEISNITETGSYYINATCWDFDERNVVQYPFEILNNGPVATVQFEFEDGKLDGLTTVVADWYDVYRGKNFTLRVNATDIDTDLSDLRLTIQSRDPLTRQAIFFSEYVLMEPTTNEDAWLFEVELTFPLSINLGIVDLSITLSEIDPEIDPIADPTGYVIDTITEIQRIVIVNNLPTISDFFMNELSGVPITVTTADTLNFTFVIEDDEDRYLWDEAENDGDKPIGYLTITFEKLGEIIKYTIPYNYDPDIVFALKISSLGIGDWAVSFSFQDKDGGIIVYSEAPSLFTVTEPTKLNPMNWLMMGVGIILGGVVVFGSTFAMLKSRTISKVRESLPEKSIESVATPSDVIEEVEEKKESKNGKKPGRKL